MKIREKNYYEILLWDFRYEIINHLWNGFYATSANLPAICPKSDLTQLIIIQTRLTENLQYKMHQNMVLVENIDYILNSQDSILNS